MTLSEKTLELASAVIALVLLAYTWTGYPLILWLLRKFFSRPVKRGPDQDCPKVSIIIAARNEEAKIAAKLVDCLNLEYPPDWFEILVVSDNSTDRTDEIVKNFATRDVRIRLLAGHGAMGKSGAQNLAVQSASGDMLFFTDVDTRTHPDMLKMLMENFADPKVGLVTANVFLGEPGNAVAEGQGMYWRFELFLRKLESELGVLATGSGQALLMRKALFRPLPLVYGDDCVLPLDVRLQEYRVVQDTRVIVYDIMPNSIHGELKARIRMTARNWSGTLSRLGILNPFRFPVTAWALISHKLLRWLTPFFLAVLLAANILLSVRSGDWKLLCALQIAFYAAALIGWLRARKGEPAWVFAYPFAFCLANVGFLLGMVKVMRGQKIASY
ncbi:MAG TPA: glycosyltransferase [Candidatus Angelobacter sp.]|jgi:cellulose synthase/poly-beta-1,6-N-acetylglucosamine synthase-like glycosyltransferase|nr:glycosyltransferase [Candidatus Angelobacter sp.]